MLDDIFLLSYFIVLVGSYIATYIQRDILTKADKWISYLLVLTIFFEACSKIASNAYHNNMFVYHIWSPIQLFMFCLYFNQRVRLLRKYSLGLIVGTLGILIAIFNAVFFQPLLTINSIFLLYEGFSIMALCLVAFYELVYYEEDIINNVHFWLSTIFLIYWSSVYVYWGMYYYLITSMIAYIKPITYSIWTVNILAYAAIAIVFLRYNKMLRANG